MAGVTDTIHVLHVDDEPSFADMVGTFLERDDDRITVKTATNAEEGQEKLAENDIDCIISDYDMPGQNGIDFLESVRVEHPELPFILFTGKGSEEVAAEAISAGVTDYLQKESGTDQYAILANRVMNAVEGYRAEREAAQTRTQLRESEERFRQLAENIEEVVWMADPEKDELLYVNPAYEAIWGQSTDTLYADPTAFLDPIHPGDQDRVEAALDTQSGGEYDEEYRIIHPNGEVRWVRDRAVPIENDEGEVYRIVGIASDITERKEQTRQLETLINNLPGIVYRCRNKSNWPMELVRGECESLTGYSATELERGDGIWGKEIIHPADQDRAWTVVQEAIDNDRPFELTYRIQTKDGAIRWMWERGRVVVPEYTEETLLEGFITDITDRKKREQDLRRIERRYQAVFNDPNILVGLLDTDGTVIDINETAIGYIDAELEDVTGERIWETPWFTGDATIQQEVRESIDRASAGEYVEFDFDLSNTVGDPLVVRGVIRPVENEDGDVVSLLISDRDITERKLRERELQRYEAYLEESSDAITVLDEDGTIKYQSPAAMRILGYEQKAFIGQNAFDFIHPDDEADVYDMFTELVDNPGETVTAEARFATADDEWRWLEVRGTNRLEHETINGIVTINRDITERKQHQHELEQTNTVLSTLFETLPVGVLAEDADRNLLALNERLFELFEFPGSPDEFAGADCEQMAQEVSELFVEPEQFVNRINELVNEAESVRNEEVLLEDGRTFTRDYEQLDLPGGHGHLWVYRDITDLKNREQALQRERDRLDEFAGVISHDLQNPLNVAEGRLVLAREECDSEHLEAIETALHRMSRITEDVLLLSREGEDIGSMDEVVLHDAIDAAWNIVADRAEHAELQGAKAPLQAAKIEADDDRLRQLLENLFSNAIDHGGEDVTVTVGALDTGFYVEDDGPGIPEDEREAVFTGGYSTGEEGTGFGLRIVKQIAEAHDWKVQITEGTEGGARFEITGVKFIAA